MYVWLPKDVEILKVDALVDRPLPKSCARCKSKSWNNATRRSVSVARIRTLLRNGKRDTVVYLLSGIGQRKKDKIIDALATNLERQQEVLELDHDIELGRIVRHRWSGDIP